MQRKRVVLGVNGGTDCLVAAVLLRSQGYEIEAVQLQFQDLNQTGPQFRNHCCLGKDPAQVEKICTTLGLSYRLMDVSDSFQEKVVDPFIHALLQGQAPSTPVHFSQDVVLASLFQIADKLNCEWVAVGLYAQLIEDPKSHEFNLYRAVDQARDQSHLLFKIEQRQLKRLLIPLGGLNGAMVDKLATEYGFNLGSNEPRTPCFRQSKELVPFIESRVANSLRPVGPILTVDGRVVGEHSGLYRYRLGQKGGILPKEDKNNPDVVVRLNVISSTLVIGNEKFLMSRALRAKRVKWVGPVDLLRGLRCEVQIKKGRMAPALVTCFENEGVHVEFKEPEGAVEPGQAIAFYNQGQLLGGAFVEEVLDR